MNKFAHKETSGILSKIFSNHAKLVEIEYLKGHEEIDQGYLEKLKEQIKSDSMLKFAIAVDRNTNVILDGHHRLQALKELGYNKIPVVFLDYSSPIIEVKTWRNREAVTKDAVIRAALSGERLPPKTSKHMIQLNGSLKHISAIESKVDAPLEDLR